MDILQILIFGAECGEQKIDKLLALKIVGVVQLVWWSQLVVVASSKCSLS